MTGKPLPEEPVDNSAPASAEAPIICMRDVSFTYDGEAFALSGASVQIQRGEFVCILGGNGSGKSTLAKHLNALLVPDKGQVEVCGMDTSERQHTAPAWYFRTRMTSWSPPLWKMTLPSGPKTSAFPPLSCGNA